MILVSLYFVIPFLLLRFYNNSHLDQILNIESKKTIWINRYPDRILTLVLLYIFYCICLHVLIFFRGIFPFFCIFMHNLEGIMLIEVTLIVLIVLIFGTLQGKRWAWWGAMLYFFVWIVSLVITFLNNSFLDMLTILSFPAKEMSVFQRLPLHGYHIIIFFGLPLMVMIIIVYRSKKYFHHS